MTSKIQVKNGVYYVIICYQEEGKHKQKWVSSRLKESDKKNKKLAEQFLHEQVAIFKEQLKLSSMYSSDVLQMREIPLCDYLQRYVENKKNTLSPNVYDNYLKRVENMREFPRFKNMKLKDLTTGDLVTYYNHFRGYEGCKHKKDCEYHSSCAALRLSNGCFSKGHHGIYSAF